MDLSVGMLASKYFAAGTQLKRIGIKLSEVRSKIPFCDTYIYIYGKYHVWVFEPLCLALMWLFMIEWGSEGAIICCALISNNGEFINKAPEYWSRNIQALITLMQYSRAPYSYTFTTSCQSDSRRIIYWDVFFYVSTGDFSQVVCEEIWNWNWMTSLQFASKANALAHFITSW